MPKSTTLARTAACGTVAALSLGAAPVAVLPQALAAPATGQQTYTCAITVDENPTEPSYMDLTANVNLNLPDQVSPGDQFSVDGDFNVQLPGEIAGLFAGYFPVAQVTSDSLTIPVNVGGQDQLVPASRIDSGRIDTGKLPLVLGGSFTTDPISVPADAQGEVAFSMPRNDSVPAISEDGMSAFTAVLVAEGGLVPGYDKGTDRVSCKSASGESSPIGSVPVSGGDGGGAAVGAPPAVTSGGGTGAGAAAGAGAAVAGGRVQAAQAGSAPAPDAAGKDNKDNKDSKDNKGDGKDAPDGSAADQALADQLRLMSMNQAANGRGDGAYISKSTVAWGVLGIVVVSVLFTVVINGRTRRMVRDHDGYGD